MKHRLWFVPVLALVALALAVVPAHTGGKKENVKVLFVLGSPPFHDIRNLPPILEKTMEKVGGFQISRLEPPKDKPANDAAHLVKLAEIKPGDYDVLVFYTTGYKLDEVQERALEKFVEAGGGIVALHGASASFGNSKVWNNLVGGRFSGHLPGTYKLDVVVSKPDHPITAGVKEFNVVDEEYTHKFADVERDVLVKFKERPKGSKSDNMDVLWTRQVGKGRVVYNALGHGKEAWTSPAWQKLTLQAILWAAGKPRSVEIGQ